jgi:short-subunit dehydrogenase
MKDAGNKTVWITGASSGIGREVASQYAAMGARVILSARNEEKLMALAAELSSNALVLPLDLTKPDTIREAVTKVQSECERLDLVFHAGGISQRSYIRDTDMEVDRRIMEVNYFGTIALTKAILPFMLEAGGGHFAVVSSLVGLFGYSVRSAYSASKHALHGFFESLEVELGPSGMSVTLICPGGIQTDISVNALMGDGSPSGKMDEMQRLGMRVEDAAEKMISAIEAKKRLVVIGSAKEKFGVFMYKFFPNTFFRIAKKQNPRGAVKL